MKQTSLVVQPGMGSSSRTHRSLVRPWLLVSTMVFSGLIAGCGRSPEVNQGPDLAEKVESPPPVSESLDPSRIDRQGAVDVEIKPLGTEGQSDDIIFEVALNTHSVDLSMDLSQLSSLTTDLGAQTSASSWTGGSGHHVQGLLVFPGVTPDGTPLLEGAQEVILIIRDVDAPERVFVWQVSEIH